MKRPVAARQPAVAAVNDPHARPIQPRRDISGEVSSGVFLAAAFAAGFFTAAAAALVVFPASAGFIGGGGAAFGFGAAGIGAALAGSVGGFWSSDIVSLALVPHSRARFYPGVLQQRERPYCGFSYAEADIVLTHRRDLRRELR